MVKTRSQLNKEAAKAADKEIHSSSIPNHGGTASFQ